jgi:hypothetical protein
MSLPSLVFFNPADCDGRPDFASATLRAAGGTDNGLFGKGEFVVLTIDFGASNTRVFSGAEVNPSVVAIGVPTSAANSTEFLGTMRVARLNGDPRFGFGAPIPGVDVTVYNFVPGSNTSIGPDATRRHLELAVSGFSKIPAALAVTPDGSPNVDLRAWNGDLPCIGLSAFLGSLDDGPIGEDDVVEQQTCPQPVPLLPKSATVADFDDVALTGCGDQRLSDLSPLYRGLEWYNAFLRAPRPTCVPANAAGDTAALTSPPAFVYNGFGLPLAIARRGSGTFGLLALRLGARDAGSTTVTFVGYQGGVKVGTAMYMTNSAASSSVVMPPAFAAVDRVEASAAGRSFTLDDVAVDTQGLFSGGSTTTCSLSGSRLSVRFRGVTDTCSPVRQYHLSLSAGGSGAFVTSWMPYTGVVNQVHVESL